MLCSQETEASEEDEDNLHPDVVNFPCHTKYKPSCKHIIQPVIKAIVLVLSSIRLLSPFSMNDINDRGSEQQQQVVM